MNVQIRTHTAFPRSMLQVLDEMPEDEKWEVIDGGLYAQAASASRHNAARDALVGFLLFPYQNGIGGPGGWWILAEQRVIGPDPERLIVEPDLAAWRRERMPQVQEPYIRVIPDWICEVLSPSTRDRDLGKKKDAYAALGVPWYWIVDPEEETIDVRQLIDGEYQTKHMLRDGKSAPLPPFMEVNIASKIVFPYAKP